jgi:hypothetical protein
MSAQSYRDIFMRVTVVIPDPLLCTQSGNERKGTRKIWARARAGAQQGPIEPALNVFRDVEPETPPLHSEHRYRVRSTVTTTCGVTEVGATVLGITTVTVADREVGAEL